MFTGSTENIAKKNFEKQAFCFSVLWKKQNSFSFWISAASNQSSFWDSHSSWYGGHFKDIQDFHPAASLALNWPLFHMEHKLGGQLCCHHLRWYGVICMSVVGLVGFRSDPWLVWPKVVWYPTSPCLAPSIQWWLGAGGIGLPYDSLVLLNTPSGDDGFNAEDKFHIFWDGQ